MSSKRLRNTVIAEWRGLYEPPEKPERSASVGDLLRKVLPKLGLAERLSEQQMQEAWQEIVGEFLAQHSVPASLKAGVLIVQVLQPTVRYELDRNWKKEILAKLKARFGAGIVKEVRFRG
jgi:predicted nucleic acid-binding Zn ribbon protein